MKYVTLRLDESNNRVYDANNTYVGCIVDIKSFENESAKRPISELIKLKEAGFTADEIVELAKEGVI